MVTLPNFADAGGFPTLLETKIASGLTTPHRLKDFADVIDLIRCNNVSSTYRERLNPFVREKYDELWGLAQHPDDEH